MKKKDPRVLKSGIWIAFLFTFIFGGCASDQETIVVNPEESDIALLNPGRGFTTTASRFNDSIGNRLHPKSGVHQMRWYWDFIEPEEGKIRFALIDSVLERAALNGQQLNFRIMCQNVAMKIPEWALAAGIKGPDYYNDPVFLEKQERLIKTLGEKYDGHPALAFMDIGTVGQWGEWHSEEKTDIEMPDLENAKKIVEMYLNGFKKTPLVMLIGGVSLEYAIEKGTGWRADCWGDYGDEWKHMEVRYPSIFMKIENVLKAWKKAPIALETCWTIDYWHEQGWDIDVALAKALQWHTTSVNNGTYPVPEEWWAKIQEFEKKLGYRFALKQLTYTSPVQAGQDLAYTMEWENKGVAPIYRVYRLAFKLVMKSDTTQEIVLKTDEDITKWMPGAIAIESNMKLPNSLIEGEYELYLGLIEENTDQPAIKLANEGMGEDGWYTMGDIEIKNN